ncbi:hypothetical protein H0H93_007701 [Arthromyces matolae]|nr:hypothetical protein H0H93_007701 [Arthromyces matolae]
MSKQQHNATSTSGRCAMRDSCGKKGFFGKDLPCPYNGPPEEPEDRQLIVQTCGAEFAEGPGSFVNVISTQVTNSGQTAVKSVDFFVEEQFGEGFYNSCKDVQVGTTNGYAMELIGGGASNYLEFFKFMGDEKPIGSPFQIDFPETVPPDLTPLNETARGCADNELASRCTCVDCPSICPALPPVSSPDSGPICSIGPFSCLSLVLVVAYALAVLGFFTGYLVSSSIRKRRERSYERMALSEDTASPRISTRGLVGQSSLAQYLDDDSLGTQSESRNLGRGVTLLDPIETVQPRQYLLNTFLRRGFYNLGLFAATSPWLTFSLVFLFMGLLNIGWKKFEIETDPVRLWVAPTSESKLQKEYFDEHFGPFYRTEQIFVTAAPPSDGQTDDLSLGDADTPVLTWHRLKYWFKIEEDIRSLSSPSGYRLTDVCFKPAGPQGACVVQSIAAWFENELGNYDEDTWAPHLDECARSPVECLPDFQQPLAPHYVLGGVPTNENGRQSYVDAASLVVTYVVSDSLDAEVQAKAMEWEQTLRTYLIDLSQRSSDEAGLAVAFSTGVSLEEEINKSTNTDVKIVVLSYLAMFFYVSLTLGAGTVVRGEQGVLTSLAQWARNFPGLFRTSSLTSSSLTDDPQPAPHFFPRLPRSLFTGSKFTLGLFGIGLVIQYLSAEERIARTLAKMGPSILLSTITETVAFALGALVPMPAVRNFALYAAGSVFLNAVLQVTVFISALLLDLRRFESSRVDCFPCIRLPSRIALADGPVTGSGLGRLGRFVRRHYAPFLLQPFVKGMVLIFFSGLFVASVISVQHIELGLDQRLALPSDSYLVDYFDKMDAYLDVGPPVYFVSRDLDVTQRSGQQALCARFTTCQELSVANSLEAERKRPEVSFISEPSASWIDDFLGWLDPGKEECCRVRKRNPDVFCGPRDNPRLCQPCYLNKTPAWNITMEGLPENEEFIRYVNQWLVSPTTEECPLAGKASFGSALALSEDGSGVEASHFRTFHSPLKTQKDFVNAFAAAHRVADDISQRTGADVFPYSLFYVFFDQYAHIVAITQEVLGLGLASVLVVTALLLGSWRTGSIVTGVVGLTVLTVMGVMPIWGISLNAISLVNLVISLGIAVEFCAHVARAYMSAGSGLPVDHPAGQKERDERMWTALVDVGPSIYYFRMWLTLIISGALHGLVLLPVILSIAGGAGFPLQEADEEWMSTAIRNDYEYA